MVKGAPNFVFLEQVGILSQPGGKVFLQSQFLGLLKIVIGPESDHWLCLSLTNSLTNCRLVNLIDVTLAFEDFNSKLVEVVTVVDVDDEKQFVEVSKLKFRRDFEACWQHHNVFVLASFFFADLGA